MKARSRTLLVTFAAVLLNGAIVFDASMLAGLGSPQATVPISERPSYSPDGREVAFWTDWRGKASIWAVSTVDGRLRPVAADPNVSASEPAWSPNGSWIAFKSNGTGSPNIWLVRPDGSGLTQLTTGRSTDDQPAWSPYGSQIAFVSNRAGPGTRSIWVINTDGSGLRRVTNASCCQNHPSFSPDGSQIVFEATAPTASHLMIMNIDGTGLRPLTTGTGAFRDSSPSWGGRGILFQSTRARLNIWMIQPDGSGLQAIPNAVGLRPTWSPDGTKFAFSGNYDISEFNFLTATIRPLVELKGYFIPIDIMPGVPPKIVSLKESTRIRVAILSAPGFDLVQQFDQTTLTFGRTGDERSLDSCAVDGVNLLCQFKMALTGFRPGDTQGILRIMRVTSEGRTPFEGRGAVQIVP